MNLFSNLGQYFTLPVQEQLFRFLRGLGGGGSSSVELYSSAAKGGEDDLVTGLESDLVLVVSGADGQDGAAVQRLGGFLGDEDARGGLRDGLALGHQDAVQQGGDALGQ